MDSVVEVPAKKPRIRQNLNLPVAECIRQFKLPQQFPSTISELCSSNLEKEKNATAIETQSMPSIISALPLSGKMKFIPNKEVPFYENLQKLKLKLPDGRDLGEVKVILPNSREKLQTKILKSSTFCQNSDKPVTWTVKSQSIREKHKTNIKNATRTFNSLSSIEQRPKERTESNPLKLKVEILNSNCNLPINIVKNNSNTIPTNSEKILNVSELKSDNQNILIHKNNDNIKKIIIKNQTNLFNKQNRKVQLVPLKSIPGFQKVIMLQKDNKQSLKSLSKKILSLKPVTHSYLNNHDIKRKSEKINFKTSINSYSDNESDSLSTEQCNGFESKRPCLEVNIKDSIDNTDNTDIIHDDESINSQIKNHDNQTINVKPKKNIMVLVPNKTSDELVTTSESLLKKNEEIERTDNCNIITDENIQLKDNFDQSNEDVDFKIIDKCNKKAISIQKVNQSINNTIKINNKNDKSQNLHNKFSVVKKAILSVQDANLRAEALKVLKDCGINVKKSVVRKSLNTTKMIAESGTQTEIFSLLKNGEFIQIVEEEDDLIKIKQTRKLMKKPISTLSVNPVSNKIHLDKDRKEYENSLDNMLENLFPDNENISNVKNAFTLKKKMRAKAMLKKLQADFEAAKYYDNNGLLSIHRAVINENMREVQKQIIMLQATKQSIDICTEDDKTSLELAVEYEVDSQIIKILLDAGAQPVSAKPVHDSAIIIASKISSQILSELLKYVNESNRSLLDAKNSEGLAALHYCAQHGNLKGVIELLNYGVDVNLQDERSGRTALFYAVETKNPNVSQEVYNEIAHELLQNGAISNIPIFSKHSVLSLIDDVKSHSLKIALNKAVK